MESLQAEQLQVEFDAWRRAEGGRLPECLDRRMIRYGCVGSVGSDSWAFMDDARGRLKSVKGATYGRLRGKMCWTQSDGSDTGNDRLGIFEGLSGGIGVGGMLVVDAVAVLTTEHTPLVRPPGAGHHHSL